MFSKIFLLLIPTISACIYYGEVPTRCLDCLDPNGNVEMTNFLTPNCSWICSGELSPPKHKGLTVDYYSIRSYIKHRYATTYVTSRITNLDTKSQQAEFSIFIPSRARISRFVVEINKKMYDSTIDKRPKPPDNKTRRTGNEGNKLRKFQIKMNLKPNSTATYHVIYEELLERKNGTYSIDLNVHPGQIVTKLDVRVLIHENQPLRFVNNTPVLIEPDELEKKLYTLNRQAPIVYKNKSSAVINFQPNRKEQERYSKTLDANVKNGLNVQFRVQYDVERHAQGGEVIMDHPYFVHYFAPEHLKPLPKYVIFVMDTSGSMHGKKMEQLRLSMAKILSQLRPDDVFSIIEFASNIYVVDIANKKGSRIVIRDSEIKDYSKFDELIGNRTLPVPVLATKQNINEAIKQVKNFRAVSLTNIITSSQLALHMVKRMQKAHKDKYEPFVMLITDGGPSSRNQTEKQALKYITEYNTDIAPIFSVGISAGSHFPFLKKLSDLNDGAALYIKNVEHVSVVLEGFFEIYSTPVLTNIRLLYGFNSTTLTKTQFRAFYDGTELVVAGKIENSHFEPQVIGKTSNGDVKFKIEFSQSTTPLDRIWAYLKTDQNIDDITNKEVPNQLVSDTLKLVLKYSFVTPLSSLTITSKDFGTFTDDKLLEPVYEPIIDLSKFNVTVDKIYRFVLPIDFPKKK